MSLYSEIFEQPACLERLLHAERPIIEDIAANLRGFPIQYAFVAARGTSDNAARYAQYLWGAANHLPLALATPSLFTYYQQPPQLRGAFVIGISQSGQSPDILRVVAEGRRQGCPTLAITNAPASPLAETAHWVIDIRSGPENAVAASKTYTSELMAIAMLSAALQDAPHAWDELGAAPGWVAQALSLDASIAQMAQRYRFMDHCVVLGRGFNYATAFEWSLKLKELTYVVAEPYSSADFRHGPIAMVGEGFPVMAVAPQGRVFSTLYELLENLRHEQGAELVVVSDQAEALALAQSPIILPAGIPEWLSPIVSIVPAQLFAYHLTRVKGYDTEAPRSIRKVTRTQ